MASRNGERSATPKASSQRRFIAAHGGRIDAGAQASVDDAARSALAWLHSARFLVSAGQFAQLPAALQPEIAFVGRSNAGKSTAINVLTQQRRLAFASRTPGRTQLINLFEVGPAGAPDARLADLPGYGFAAVPREDKARWQQEMTRYLIERPSLRAIVLLVDSRLGLTDLDLRLLDLVGARLADGSLKALVLLTKADKLNRREAEAAMGGAQRQLGARITEASDVRVCLFSALGHQGIEDAALVLREWIGP